jgi:pimeloyl-ACP methyl ester carboxylesterase
MSTRCATTSCKALSERTTQPSTSDQNKRRKTVLSTARSNDGTRIAFSRVGEGPPVILVDGALCYRKVGASTRLAARLAEHFTVYTYDRRGRGESGDTEPYAIEREVEDLRSLIDAAGGSVYLYGVSSGAALALETAARRGVRVRGLVLYEAPFSHDQSRAAGSREYSMQLSRLLAADRRGDAVRLFLRRAGLPAVFAKLMRLLPIWSKLEALAPTLAYDDAVLGVAAPGEPLPAERWATVTIPCLCAAGGKSPPWMQDGMRALARALPNASFQLLEGQTHVVKPKVHAPLLQREFTGDNRVAAVGHPTIHRAA